MGMGMEFSQPKRMKIDNGPSARVSYIQQLTQDGSPAPTKEAVLERVRSLKAENNVIEAFGYLVEMWELFKPESDPDFDAVMKELTPLVRDARNSQADADGVPADVIPPAATNAEGQADANSDSMVTDGVDGENGGQGNDPNVAQAYADAYQDGYHEESAHEDHDDHADQSHDHDQSFSQDAEHQPEAGSTPDLSNTPAEAAENVDLASETLEGR